MQLLLFSVNYLSLFCLKEKSDEEKNYLDQYLKNIKKIFIPQFIINL